MGARCLTHRPRREKRLLSQRKRRIRKSLQLHSTKLSTQQQKPEQQKRQLKELQLQRRKRSGRQRTAQRNRCPISPILASRMALCRSSPKLLPTPCVAIPLHWLVFPRQPC